MAREKRFPLAPGMTVPDMPSEEHLRAREFFDELEIDGEVVRVPGVPSHFSTLRPQRPRRAPVLGEHTAEILGGELGRTPSALTQLRRAGII
jgi:crotonobetainyl-CoA:carnitine CoA-transferase CaiB-like acyl-CoA transferase